MSAQQKNILQCRLANLRKKQIEIVHYYDSGQCKDCEKVIKRYAHYLAVLTLQDHCDDSYLSCPKITGDICVYSEEAGGAGFTNPECTITITGGGPIEPNCSHPNITQPA